MNWLEVAVQVPPEGLELVAEIFHDLGTGGVVIEDPAVIQRYESVTDPDEWGVKGLQPDASPVVKGYFAVNESLTGRLEELKAAVANLELLPAPRISYCEIAEEDWANCWKAYYKPVRLGKHLVIKPSWEDFQAETGDIIIELDPGMSFGSGNHPTTTMCLELLEKHIQGGESVYDIGTGSGILAIAAALLGAGSVKAVDLDPVACVTAIENVRRNGVADRVQINEGDLLSSLDGKADIIVANIIARVIAQLAADVVGRLAPGGIFIASGIISEKGPEVIAALEKNGLNVIEQLKSGDWVALVAQGS